MDISDADLEALRMQAADAMARLETVRANYADLQRELRGLTVTTTSDDALVTATVGAHGRLVALELDPRIYRRPDSRRLAETITATIQRAADEAAEKVTAMCRPFFPDEDVRAHLNYDIDAVVRRVDEDLLGGGAR